MQPWVVREAAPDRCVGHVAPTRARHTPLLRHTQTTFPAQALHRFLRPCLEVWPCCGRGTGGRGLSPDGGGGGGAGAQLDTAVDGEGLLHLASLHMNEPAGAAGVL